MRDLRNEFIQNIEMALPATLSKQQENEVMAAVMNTLEGYELSERTTALTVTTNNNIQIIKYYFGNLSLEGKSPKTIYVYKSVLSNFMAFMNNKPLTDIVTFDIRSYLASEKARGIADRTVDHKRSVIMAFFQWLTNEGYLDKNPVAAVSVIKYSKRKETPFSNIERDELQQACKTTKERALIEFLWSTGVRVQEFCDLNVEDIDFNQKSVYIAHGKGDKERTTYIDDLALKYLIQYLTENGIECGALFKSKSGDDERYTTAGIRDILRRIAKRTSVTDVHPHRFRRTFACTLASRGMKVQDIQQLMGHASIETTMGYINVVDSQVSNAYRKYTA